MATAKRARANAEPKELKLCCKCDDCRHWEIILVRETPKKGGSYERAYEYIQCMTCGTKVTCYFSTGAHEGLHYEAHKPTER